MQRREKSSCQRDVKLKQTAKNEIFGTIKEKQLDPNRFSWVNRSSNLSQIHGGGVSRNLSGNSVTALILKHEGNEFRFTFEINEFSNYHSFINPQIIPGENVLFAQNWNGLLRRFEDWLDVVKYELEEPDLWKELPRGQALTAIPSDYSADEKFSAEERRLLAERLAKIQKFIVESNQLKKTAQIQIQQTFIYLQQRAETTSKLDWKNLFAGAILSLILEKAVNNAPEIMKLCNELLSPFFQKLLQ
jgi:hypothetical protein